MHGKNTMRNLLLACAMLQSAAALSWSTLGVPSETSDQLANAGLTVPTRIQSAALPAVIAGGDMVLHAETGSGKTLAYLLNGKPTIVLAPSKILCRQIEACWESIGGERGSLFSGEGVAVATPKEVLAAGRHNEKLANMCIVLDEADALLRPAGKYDRRKDRRTPPGEKAARKLFRAAPDAQLIAASATVGRPLRRLLGDVTGRKDQMIRVVRVEEEHSNDDKKRLVSAPRTLEHVITRYHGDLGHETLVEVLDKYRTSESTRMAVAVESPDDVDPIVEMLRRQYSSQAADLREDASSPLVVADARALRGLDLDLDIVVLFGLPPSPDDYLHVAGRTARNGNKGTAITVASYSDARVLTSWTTILGGIAFKTSN